MSFPRLAHAVLLMLGVAVALLVATPASSHDELVDSSPSSGQTLDAPPSQITLTFSGPPMELGATVLVVDSDGLDHATGPPVFDSRTATVPVDPLPADAWYQVRWRVVSADGHVLSGVVDFGVGDTAEADPMPEPASTSAGSTTAATTDSADDENGVDDRTAVVALTGALIALLLTAGGWRLRTRPGPRVSSATPNPTTEENS